MDQSKWKKFKKYFLYVVVITVTIVSLYTYVMYVTISTDQKIVELKRVEQLKKEKSINDSLKILHSREMILNQQNQIVQEKIAFFKKADSTITNARYQPGSIVYMKPDSIRAVVDRIDFLPGQTQINYILLLDHKESGQPTCRRADYLIF